MADALRTWGAQGRPAPPDGHGPVCAVAVRATATLPGGWTAVALQSRGDALRIKLERFLDGQGYRLLRRLGGVLCGLHRFNFTVGLVVGLSFDGYERRYCYEHGADARAALAAWDGSGHPPGPWIKCKGAGIDLLNPRMLIE